MDLSESPPREEMRRVEVVPLASCVYACPGCPVGGGGPSIPTSSRSPSVRLAGSIDLAAEAARRLPRGVWIEWWGATPEGPSREGFETLARAGVRSVGLVALGCEVGGAGARGWRGSGRPLGGERPPGPEEILARLEEARGAGLQIQLVLPEVGKSRYNPEMLTIGWEEAALLQRAAWNAGTKVLHPPHPPCFQASA